MLGMLARLLDIPLVSVPQTKAAENVITIKFIPLPSFHPFANAYLSVSGREVCGWLLKYVL